MHRFVVDANSIILGGRVVLPKDEAAHALRVLRLREGDTVGLLDGAGHAALCAIVSTVGQLTCEVTQLAPDNEPRVRVTLYQGLPKLDKLESIIQKSTQLGVHRIVPVRFSRCDVKELSPDRVIRGNRVALEASKQCGRAWIPRVEPLISFDECVSSVKRDGRPAFLMWERATERFSKACALVSNIHDDNYCLSIIIGPEGGITEDEAERLSSAGASPVSLGRRILRTETAPVAALAILMSVFNEM